MTGSQKEPLDAFSWINLEYDTRFRGFQKHHLAAKYMVTTPLTIYRIPDLPKGRHSWWRNSLAVRFGPSALVRDGDKRSTHGETHSLSDLTTRSVLATGSKSAKLEEPSQGNPQSIELNARPGLVKKLTR